VTRAGRAHDEMVVSPHFLRALLFPALEAVDICLLCAACRSLRHELQWLRSFSVRFGRAAVDDHAIESLGKTIALISNVDRLSLCLAYQTASVCDLARNLRELPRLTRLARLTLDLRHCNLGDAGLEEWCGAVERLEGLSQLGLRVGFNRISGKGAEALAGALASLSLQDVVLEVDINPIRCGAIALLRSLLSCRKVHLDMAHCRICDAVAVDLAGVLESQSGSMELLLDLRGNQLNDSKSSIVKAAQCINQKGCKCLVLLD